MPALVAGIHVFTADKKGVNGRDKPGHDAVVVSYLGAAPVLPLGAAGSFFGPV
jgi:hypothetical protein